MAFFCVWVPLDIPTCNCRPTNSRDVLDTCLSCPNAPRMEDFLTCTLNFKPNVGKYGNSLISEVSLVVLGMFDTVAVPW